MKKLFFLIPMIMLVAAACNNQQAGSLQNQQDKQGKGQQQTNQGTSAGGETTKVKIFVIAPDDNGKTGKAVGCGDSMVAIEKTVPQTTEPLKAALEQLLSLKVQFIGQSGLYNSLSLSDLKIDSLNLKDGKAVVKLSGAVTFGGVCDNPRFVGQIQETVMQFGTVKVADIYVNGKLLNNFLSEKGNVPQNTETIKVYFVPKDSQQPQCNEVLPVGRDVIKTAKIATAAISELLKGPSAAEKDAGITSLIPAGSKLNSLKIVDGVAYADFNQATEMGGGSCRQGVVITQISQTLMQFPTVKSVKFSIDGNSNPSLIFQP